MAGGRAETTRRAERKNSVQTYLEEPPQVGSIFLHELGHIPTLEELLDAPINTLTYPSTASCDGTLAKRQLCTTPTFNSLKCWHALFTTPLAPSATQTTKRSCIAYPITHYLVNAVRWFAPHTNKKY
eukprot:GHVT01080000.1.p3 GENE.GHVT01080000.1~~GHVT01080000.1.p3  ORF type:complete len:127 (+),score=1.62 GHVT01080000.1:721-1101(+)